MYISDKNDRAGSPLPVRIIMGATGLILGFLLTRAFLTSFTVSDNSMTPAFADGDRILILKTSSPAPGDIVLFRSPSEPDRVLLKRVIAAEGDVIEVRNKVFYRNNQKMKFPWKTISSDERVFPMNFTYRDNVPAMKVGRKQYFVLGDNLDYSYDSRSFGLITGDGIIGRFLYKW